MCCLLYTSSAAAEQRQVTLELRGDPVQVHGVPQIVDEILYNLCDNAVVYNRPGGKVCVTVEEMCIRDRSTHRVHL